MEAQIKCSQANSAFDPQRDENEYWPYYGDVLRLESIGRYD